jgi:hypothetical protein
MGECQSLEDYDENYDAWKRLAGETVKEADRPK